MHPRRESMIPQPSRPATVTQLARRRDLRHRPCRHLEHPHQPGTARIQAGVPFSWFTADDAYGQAK